MKTKCITKIFTPLVWLLLCIISNIACAQVAGANKFSAHAGLRPGPDTADHSPAMVTTLAGTGISGGTDGKAAEATFNGPSGIVADRYGNLYIAEIYNHKIRKIAQDGVVTTFAGSGSPGSADGSDTGASFNGPCALAVDAAGNLFVADRGNQKIRRITSAGVVTTFAGSGNIGGNDGTGAAASFNWPTGIATDTVGNVYVADYMNYKIRKISPAGDVSTVVTSLPIWPAGLTTDVAGNVYATELNNNKILKITPAGIVTTFAGNFRQGSTDATGTAASFNLPIGIVMGPPGDLYVTEQGTHIIRRITPDGVVTTVAGNGSAGSNDGAGKAASFNLPVGIACDAAGNVYIADQSNNKIRSIIVR